MPKTLWRLYPCYGYDVPVAEYVYGLGTAYGCTLSDTERSFLLEALPLEIRKNRGEDVAEAELLALGSDQYGAIYEWQEDEATLESLNAWRTMVTAMGLSPESETGAEPVPSVQTCEPGAVSRPLPLRTKVRWHLPNVEPDTYNGLIESLESEWFPSTCLRFRLHWHRLVSTQRRLIARMG